MPDVARAARSTPRTRNDLRCFCRRTPLLAVYGIDVAGKLYLHVMIHRQQRIYCNIVVRGGPLELQCRECLRWHVIHFSAGGTPTMKESNAPVEVPAPPFLVGTEE